MGLITDRHVCSLLGIVELSMVFTQFPGGGRTQPDRPNRTRPTLETATHQSVQPGTTIMTDGWASCAHLNTVQGGLCLHRVVHGHHFFDHNDATHARSVGTKSRRTQNSREKKKQSHISRVMGVISSSCNSAFVVLEELRSTFRREKVYARFA